MPPSSVFCSAASVATRRVLCSARSTTLCPRLITTPAARSIATYSDCPNPQQRQGISQSRSRSPPAKLPASQRQYHSRDHPPPPGPFTPSEATLLSAAYRHVPSHGFTPESLALGARDAGLLDISPSILPNGIFDLIRWHLYTQRTSLAAKAQRLEAENGPMTVADKVEALTWERLKGNVEAGVVPRWQEVCLFFSFWCYPFIESK